MDSYTFSCMILGDPPFQTFDITIDGTATVSKIRPLIIEALSPLLERTTPNVLHLWRVDILLSKDDGRFKLLESVSDHSHEVRNATAFIKTELEGKMPNGNTRIFNYFGENTLPDVPEDHPGYINFVVECPESVFTSPPAISEPGHKRKASDESEHERYMKRLAKLPCPSDLVRSWQQKSSADPLFLNHRPASSKGLPTELLHPIFGNFLDDCRNAVPTSEDYVFTKLVSEEMSAYYPSETARAQKFRELFKKHFTINLNCIEFDGSKTDGTWSPNAEADFVAMNAEIKKEPGAGNPHIQNVAYYKQYLSEHQNDFVEKIRLPCFLVQVDGPELNISTVIYGNKIIVDPYHFTLSLACSSTRLEDFARIFHALKNAFEALRTYYNGPPPEISPSQRQYPYPNSFRTTHGEIQFKYHTALNSHPFVCLVDVLGNQPDLPRRLVVKFTRQYPHAIHQACANLRIAPELYGFETLPGGWFMVIMTYMVDYSTLVEYAPNPLIKAEVKKAMGQLHLLGFVHGDLRDVNILVRRSDADSAVNIVFVDWDWAGKDGEVNYPLSINPDIPRHPEAKALKAIRIDHDEFMFQNLFSSCS